MQLYGKMEIWKTIANLAVVALQPFRVAAVELMAHSAVLEATVTGGVLLRTMPLTPGTVSCTTITAM